MTTWKNRIEEYRKVSLNIDFLGSRVQGEDGARQLLVNKGGSFKKGDLKEFLLLCNTERVPPNLKSINLKDINSNSRFQRSFKGNNENLIIDCVDAFNKWIHDLWNAQSIKDTLGILDNIWKRNPIKGAGTGFPTMIMYLKYQMVFNIWIKYLQDAILAINNDTKILRHRNIKRSVDNYMSYNESVNDYFLEANIFSPQIEPQEIDYILYRVSLDM